MPRSNSRRVELTPWVFHNIVHGKPGTPIIRFYRSWKTACKAAGIPTEGAEKKIFHDFRRMAVRHMIRAGVPRQTAKKISGHITDSIFGRSDIVDEDDLRHARLTTQQHLHEVRRKIGTLPNRGQRDTAASFFLI